MTTATRQQNNFGLGFLAGLILLLIAITAGITLISDLDTQAPTLAAIKPIPHIQY